MSLNSKQVLVQIKDQKVQREMQLSPLPARLSVPFDERFRNPLDGNPVTNKDMTVDGSSTSVIFEFKPGATEVFLVEYVTITLIDDGSFLANEFGSIGSALSTGLLLKSQQDGQAFTHTTVVNNADVMQCFGGIIGVTGTGVNTGVFGSGDWIAGKYEFRNECVLFGEKGDFMHMEVNDDLQLIDFLQSSIRVKSVES